MTRFGLDSTSMVSVRAQHAVGCSVAIRYLGHDTSKVVTRAEHEQYKAAGIDLFLVFEDGGRPDLSDYPGGKANAEFAVKQAADRLGPVPRPVRIAFAWDDDPNANPAAADPYYDGVRAVMGPQRSGPYGGKALISHQADRGFEVLYQTYAWSDNQWDERSRVRQVSNDHVVGGVGVDYDRIFPGAHGDFGQVDFHPTAPDFNHYARFDKTRRADLPRPWLTSPTELAVVKQYDRYRARQTHLRHPHRSELAVLRHQLDFLAYRIVREARKEKPAAWNPYWRSWRFPQLLDRSRGQLVA